MWRICILFSSIHEFSGMLLESTWYLYSFIQLSSICNEGHRSDEVRLNNREASIGNRYSSMQLRDIHFFAVDIAHLWFCPLNCLCYSLDCWNEFPVQLRLMIFYHWFHWNQFFIFDLTPAFLYLLTSPHISSYSRAKAVLSLLLGCSLAGWTRICPKAQTSTAIPHLVSKPLCRPQITEPRNTHSTD